MNDDYYQVWLCTENGLKKGKCFWGLFTLINSRKKSDVLIYVKRIEKNRLHITRTSRVRM